VSHGHSELLADCGRSPVDSVIIVIGFARADVRPYRECPHVTAAVIVANASAHIVLRETAQMAETEVGNNGGAQ
jgi:hypothetical protein